VILFELVGVGFDVPKLHYGAGLYQANVDELLFWCHELGKMCFEYGFFSPFWRIF
jgi:hypothetical protein